MSSNNTALDAKSDSSVDTILGTVSLDITSLSLNYDKNIALKDISLCLEEGQIACMIGPSGCGKTSLLRAIAGFEKAKSGRIRVNSKTLFDDNLHVEPEHREIGMMFQDFALFPHLTIKKNIAFGIRKQKKNQQEKRITELAERLNIENLLYRYPHEISGGQQQRVALARAIAPSPSLLLMDEPFSNIDPELKNKLVYEIRDIIKQEGITTLLVTHDQLEAFALGDIVGVMNHGELQQWDSAYNLYHKPKNIFVSSFIGLGSFIPCVIRDNTSIECDLGILSGNIAKNIESTDFKVGDKAKLFLRPDDVIHDDSSQLQIEIVNKQFRGAEFLYQLKIENGFTLQCFAPSHHNHKIGEKIGIKLDTEHLILFK